MFLLMGFKSVEVNNSKAALLMVFSMLLISANDVILKLASDDLGVGQLLFIRGLLASLIFSGVIIASGRPLIPKEGYSFWVVGRAFCETCATLCFISALVLLPIATVSTLVWTSPFFLTILAVIFLSEKVPVARWVALLLGFVGMLLVTNPFSEAFEMVMVLPLLAAFFVSVRDIVTRKVDINLHSMYITLPTLVCVSAVGLLLSFGRWQTVEWSHIGWLGLSAVLLCAGFFTQIAAIRCGELSFVSPFVYVGVVSAVFWGYVVWGDVPTGLTIVGMLVIVASSIYVVLRGVRR